MPRGLAAEQLAGAQQCPACNVLNSCTRLECTPEAQNVRCAIIRGVPALAAAGVHDKVACKARCRHQLGVS
jgi:hypothetical protein